MVGSSLKESHCPLSAVAPPSTRKRVPPSLFDNGKGTAKSQCGQPTAPSGARGCEVNALDNGQRPFLMPVGSGGPYPGAGSPDRSPGGQPPGEISMESLILAQDERWRRA
jgi:hypothetical protein